MAEVNPRNLVVDILLAVDKEEEFSHVAIRNTLDKYRYLPHHDRAFIKRLAEGTIERTIELDFVLDQYSKTKTDRMKPVILAILRSAVYQLLYMDGVPDAAACNEAVNLAVKRGFAGLRSFVNGVLRTVSREKESINYPTMLQSPIRYFSIRYSMPEWIVHRMINQHGREGTEKILAAFLAKHETCVRVDVTKISPLELKEALEARGITVRPHKELAYAFYLDGYDALDTIPEFNQGLFYVQDVTSMMVTEIANPEKGDLVLDVCAAPGGKSLHVAHKLEGTGRVIARDLTPQKVAVIEKNIAHFGVKNMEAQVWDALNFDPALEGKANLVIADLPCSGLGVIGNKSDIKYRVTEGRIHELAELQRRILDVVCRYVKPEGTLLYSTCTMTEEENHWNVMLFLDQHPEFALDTEQAFLPGEDSDGFYIAKLIRRG